MNPAAQSSLRVLILAPHGRDAALAEGLLTDAGIEACTCSDLPALIRDLDRGAGAALVTEEALRAADIGQLYAWIGAQPPWADVPIILLTHRGGGIERNPTARRLTETLGNVSFIERPFHPTTLVSLLDVALRGRRRQYEARERLEEIHAGEEALRQVNTTLERRVEERTAQLAQASEALRQSQKLEAIGRLTGGVAHDFNNLLMVISGGLEVMDRQSDPARRTRIVDGMRLAAGRGARLTRQLLAFSRSQTLHPEAVSLVRQVQGMKTLLDHALRGDVVVDTDLPADLWPVEVDPTELELVMLNLCVNARDAMPRGGRIRIEGRNVHDPAGDRVRLSISDTGVGMSPRVQARVFEPFFTTKDIGKGSGLGLAQVYGFATQSGGSVHIDSAEGAGTTVVLSLPRTENSPDAPAEHVPFAGRAALDGPAGGTILLVEDDDEVAALVGEMLIQLGYDCTRVAGPTSALGALADGRRIDAVFSDIMMPGGVNGLELAMRLRERRPDLPILLTSGYASAFQDEAADLSLALLPKPYDIEALQEALTGVLGADAVA